MTAQQNIQLFKKIFSELIYHTAKIEKINMTFPETKTILDGMTVAGVKTDDVQVVLNLKNACQYVIDTYDEDFSLKTMLQINRRVAYNESLEWGVLRWGNVSIGGTSYLPDIPQQSEVESFISAADLGSVQGIVTFMYQCMKRQLFWDGNKRSSILIANLLLIQRGLGCLLIKESMLEEFNQLLHNYYEKDELQPFLDWTLKHCLVKIEIEK